MALATLESLWTPIKIQLEKKRLKPLTIRNRYYSFRSLLKIVDVNSISDLGKVEIANKYLKELFESGLKDQVIKGYLSSLSSTIKYLIKVQAFEKKSYGIEANPYEYLLETTHFNQDMENYPIRTREEIEFWISTMPELENRLVYCLGAMGLRKNEVFNLRKEQFDLKNREIRDVQRKGRKIQKRLGIPLWLMKWLSTHLDRIEDYELLFVRNHRTVCDYYSDKHFKDLTNMLYKLKKDESLSEKYAKAIKILELIQDSGKITMHSLRASWDTFADSEMKDTYRKFHMNHVLGGMDDTYVQLYKSDKKFAKYLEDLDVNGPNYEFEEI